MERIAKTVPEDARKLSDAFWPGPLTMIVEKGDAVPYATTGGMDTVAVRMPNHPIALDLIRRSGCLIARQAPIHPADRALQRLHMWLRI